MITIIMILAVMLQPTPDKSNTVFFDDFSDGNISDWDQRCLPGNWSATPGHVHANTMYNCTAIVPPGNMQYEDCVISVRGTAVHVLGMVSRLDSNDTGIYAYVSPDHDVARIRLISSGNISTIYASLYTPFPSDVWYDLTLTCEGNSLQLEIEVPSTGESWMLSATDPCPLEGQFGLAAGDEPDAHWDWISVSSGTSPGDSTMISWMYTDDSLLGNGNMAFESGEQIDLHLQLSNPESVSLENAFAILQSLSSEITVVDNNNNYGDIPVGETSWGDGSYSLEALSSAAEDQAYPLQMTVFADDGYINTFNFSIPLGCGLDCDVESGIEQWSWNAVEPGWLDNWHISSSRNHTASGVQSFKCGDNGSGDYDNNLYSALTSPLLNVPLNGEISFWTWIDAQIPLTTSAGMPALDGGLIQYGRCGTWIDLEPSTGYPYSIVPASTGPFADSTGVFSGQSAWSQWELIIPDSLAGPGQIRFVFGSDDAGTREGLYVDDIRIQGFVGIADPEFENRTVPSLSAYPNPFANGLTFVASGLPRGEITLEIFDLAGRMIESAGFNSSGEVRTMQWGGRNIPAGIYITRLCVQGYEEIIQRIVKLD